MYQLKHEVDIDRVSATEVKNDAVGVDIKFVLGPKMTPRQMKGKPSKDKEKIYRIVCKSVDNKNSWINLVEHQREEKKMKRIFGTSLGEIIIREESDTGIPLVVSTLCCFLSQESRARCEGIFRVAGRKEDTDQLRHIFDRGGQKAKTVGRLHFYYSTALADLRPLSFTDLSKYNLFSVCDCLKQFFRALPEPLLGFELYNRLLAVQSMRC